MRSIIARSIVACVCGLCCGWVLFELVAPAFLGEHPAFIFDREAAILFVFRLFPFLVIPGVCLIVVLLRPASWQQTVWLAGIVAFSFLVPLPVVNEWNNLPLQYGLAPTSREGLTEVFVLSGFLLMLSLMTMTVALFVTFAINRFARKKNVKV